MPETSVFVSLSLTAAVLVTACIVGSRSIASSKRLALIFYIVSAAMSVAAFLRIVLDSIGVLPPSLESPKLLHVLIYRGWVVIGTAISSVLLILVDLAAGTKLRIRDATRCFVSSPYLLWGLSLSVSLSFICTEIGKAAHDADMRQFFLQSGYSVWFLYFIMVAETCGAIGLLFPRTLLPAAFGLSFIMAGAIRTHVHNRDPFSDSLEAVHLLVLLVCIIVIRLVRDGASSRQSEAGAGALY